VFALRYAGFLAGCAVLALGLPATAATGAAQERALTQASPVITAELNIPAYRLDVWRDSLLIRSYAVAVGLPDFPTPIGDLTITSVTWNPSWRPPASEWAKDEAFTPPGPTNPMGKVKLLIGNAYYLHGTPASSSIGRAASHGCVRMHNEDAVDLASVLQKETGAALDSITLDSLLSSWR